MNEKKTWPYAKILNTFSPQISYRRQISRSNSELALPTARQYLNVTVNLLNVFVMVLLVTYKGYTIQYSILKFTRCYMSIIFK